MVRSTHENRPLTIQSIYCYKSTIVSCTFVDDELTDISRRAAYVKSRRVLRIPI